jgi:NAD-dependent deacetylase
MLKNFMIKWKLKWASNGATMDIDPFVFEQLEKADRIVALTGAGISAESGVPTFRGEEGLWKKLKPEELANFDAFIENPQRVTEWYEHRRDIIDNVKPNAGHYALAEMENIFPSVSVITQNVDGLHQKAGSTNVVELHGNIYRNYCIDCGKRYDYGNMVSFNGTPTCEECGGLIRPDVVWFGEMLPMEAINEADRLASNADVLFSVGTSAVVYPAAGLPRKTKAHNGFVVEVNPERTDISLIADESIREKSGVALPTLLQKYKKWQNS